VPIEYTLGRVMQRVTPAYRSGAVVDFEVRRMQAVTGALVQGGQPLVTTEFSIELAGTPMRSMSGVKGEIYLEGLPPGQYRGRTSSASGSCEFTIAVPASEEVIVDVGNVACR